MSASVDITESIESFRARSTERAGRAPAQGRSLLLVPEQTSASTVTPQPVPQGRPLLGIRSARRIAAWMVVPPVDAVMLLLPLLWASQNTKAILLMAGVALVVLNGTGRFRARLHLSVVACW